MTTRILRAMEAYLRPIIAAEGGTVELSGSPEHTLAKLGLAPQKWRCILQWQSEDPLPSVSQGSQRMNVLIILQQGAGLSIGAGNAELQLLERMEFVRHHVRAMKLVGQFHNQFPPPCKNARFMVETQGDKAFFKGLMFTVEIVYGLAGVRRVEVPVD